MRGTDDGTQRSSHAQRGVLSPVRPVVRHEKAARAVERSCADVAELRIKRRVKIVDFDQANTGAIGALQHEIGVIIFQLGTFEWFVEIWNLILEQKIRYQLFPERLDDAVGLPTECARRNLGMSRT